MFFYRIGCTAVCPSVFCKQTTRSWRFCSNVSSIEKGTSDIKSSDGEILNKSTKTRRRPSKSQTTGLGPVVFSSIRKKNPTVRIIDVKAASTIVKEVDNIFDKENVILEFDAGSGLLSKALLNGGMKNLVAFEPEESYHDFLKPIKQSHKKFFNYFLKGINELLTYSDEEVTNNLPGINNFNEGCHVQIIGQISSWHLLTDITRRLRHERSFLRGKALNLCVCLPENAWEQFLDSKLQKMCLVERILFQVAFDYKVVATLKKRQFNFSSMNKVEPRLVPDLNDDIFLVHVKSKASLSQELDLSEFQVFLTEFHNCASRNRLVIPSLEQWAPSCGEELVRRGMLVFTRFSDLQPEELLQVFLYFRSLPIVEGSELLSEWRSEFHSSFSKQKV